jgi:hypothetical protein
MKLCMMLLKKLKFVSMLCAFIGSTSKLSDFFLHFLTCILNSQQWFFRTQAKITEVSYSWQ